MKKFRAAAVFLILLMPLFFFILMKEGKHNFRYLEYYGPKHLATNGVDTIYHTLTDFSLKNIEGNSVSLSNTDPSYWVFQFFNASCQEPCKEVFTNMYDVARDFATAPKVKLLSITTHPKNDSIPVLKQVMKMNSIHPPQWQLCTGDSLEIDSLMRTSFFLKGNTNAALNTVFLVDSKFHLRGIYDGADLLEMKRLKDDIKILSYETRQKSK